MNVLLKGLSNLSTRAIYVIYGVFSLLLIFHFFTDFSKDNYGLLLAGFLFLCSAGIFLLRKGSSYLEKFNERTVFLSLLAICFIVKLAWVCMHQIDPRVDYATYYYTAEALSQSFVIDKHYVALFPHIFGYAVFLSIFFKIFGASYMVAPIVNVVLTTISMGLLYAIGKKIGGMKVAITASILWIISPSQTIYNMFVLSEPLYCTILLLIWLMMMMIHEKFQNINISWLMFYSGCLAVLLVFMNTVRPIAAVPLIALAIWLFIIDTAHVKNKRILSKKLVYLLTVVASYYVLSIAANQYVTARLGEEIATTPGYNMYVGFNMKSYGTWNPEDSALLGYYDGKEGWTANDAQKQMLEETKDRIQNEDIDFLELLFNKFIIFLGDDSAAVAYASPVLDHTIRYTLLSNVFYYFLIAASILGAFFAYKHKHKFAIFFICLYAIGLTIAQMLVEVAARYHYSILMSMILLGAFGIHHLFNKEQSLLDNK